MPRVYGYEQRPVPLPSGLWQRAIVGEAIRRGVIKSQRELSQVLGTTESNVSRWMAGRQPRPDFAARWKRVLEMLEVAVRKDSSPDWASLSEGEV